MEETLGRTHDMLERTQDMLVRTQGITQLAWKHLDIPPIELMDVARERDIGTSLLTLLLS